jgi:hypothetical protein
MFKLVKSNGDIIFDSHYEVVGEIWKLSDKSRYSLYINAGLTDISCELFINDVLCRTVFVDSGKTGCITFKTGVADKIKIRRYPIL